MIEEALSLYKRCFPEDSDAVTDVVFSERLNAADRREKRADGKLVSVLWLVEKKILFRGRIVPVKHIVGLCTAPEYRNRGYAKALLAETLATLTGTPFVTLYPFDHAFYEKMGFATVSFDDDPPVGATKASVDADLLVDLYRDFCRDLDYYDLYFSPVPLHPSRFRERGYNQAELIARALASLTGGTVRRWLRRTAFRVSQTKLSQRGREQNVAGVFAPNLPKFLPARGTLVIVDDVYTTGATTGACLDALGKNFPLDVKVCTLLYDCPASASMDLVSDKKAFWDAWRRE